MFRRVLVATDFSQCAEQLWHCLNELRELGTRELLIVHITPLMGGGRMEDYACRRLEERKREVEQAGFIAEVFVRTGLAAQEINDIAAEEQADLILVGAKGENIIRKIFLGSTVRDLIRIGKTPILVEKFKQGLPKQECVAVCARKFKKILLPTDFSEASMRVYNLVKDRLARHVDEVVLVHVVDRGHTEDLVNKWRAEAADRLNALRQNLEDAGLVVKVHLAVGIPHEYINRFAEEEDVSLIMLATRGAGDIKELLIGSTAENVARYSGRPVLLFPVRKR